MVSRPAASTSANYSHYYGQTERHQWAAADTNYCFLRTNRGYWTPKDASERLNGDSESANWGSNPCSPATRIPRQDKVDVKARPLFTGAFAVLDSQTDIQTALTAREDGLHPACRVALQCRQDMGVDIDGCGNPAMPEDLHDCSQFDTPRPVGMARFPRPGLPDKGRHPCRRLGRFTVPFLGASREGRHLRLKGQDQRDPGVAVALFECLAIQFHSLRRRDGVRFAHSL
ncbi:hypothetical protein NITHO_1040015 [Nitrolancea hollandica Lb]|uniref:Uncharacterized protein n=1 Tax=Nitrolancea hollandica Lb TaxID=1129897 RepID=I4ECI0_9BACT|nr:hypothetical protein NITHO_1040015 [Nitrolancea hollandica Lb]